MADFISNDILRVIESLEEKGVNLSGCVTDNTAKNRAAWMLLKEKYPDKFFHGCVSHGLHLLVRDIFSATKAKRGREVANYPDGYPFENLLEFAISCKENVPFFHITIK